MLEKIINKGKKALAIGTMGFASLTGAFAENQEQYLQKPSSIAFDLGLDGSEKGGIYAKGGVSFPVVDEEGFGKVSVGGNLKFYTSEEEGASEYSTGIGGSGVVFLDLQNTILGFGIEAGLMSYSPSRDGAIDYQSDALSFNFSGCGSFSINEGTSTRVCLGYDTLKGVQKGIGFSLNV